MMIVGLTGGIGSGKTTVASFFKELGVPVYIADEAGRELMNTSEKVKSLILEVFGQESYSPAGLNRKFLASRVFQNPAELEKLNAIVHPAVSEHFDAWQKQQTYPYVIYEAAILFESGGYRKCDKIILVTANYNDRITRLVKRDAASVAEIEARMKNQWSDEKKLKFADFHIKNTDISSTRKQVGNIHEILLKPSKN